MLAERRQDRILEELAKEEAVSVTGLCGLTGASEATIRRDLRELETRGKLERVHGGAVIIRDVFHAEEPGMADKQLLHTEEKKQIAKYAASLVQDDDVVFLDGGSTVMYMVDYLNAPNATFVTNSVVCAQLLPLRGLRTYVLGGVIKPRTLAIIGGEAMERLRSYNFTKAFLGTNGIAVGPGFTTPDPEEAGVKAAAAASARDVLVLADSSKFGTITASTFLALEGAQIVTEAMRERRYLENADIHVV